jgi:predicted DNA-binding protein with PD1-like motif
MEFKERKLGRIFQIFLTAGEDFFGELNRFAKEKEIRAGSVFVFGALKTVDMIAGFRSLEGFDLDRHHFEGKHELLALGNISWPDKPPKTVGEDPSWNEPRPFFHLHLAMSGAVGKTEEVLVGHLSDGTVSGMFVEIYELL